MPTNGFEQGGMAKEGTRKEEWPQDGGFTAATSESEKVCAQLNSSIDDESRARLLRRIRDAYEWAVTFEKPFQYVCDRLEEDYRAGRRLSLQIVWEELRRKEWSGRRGESFRLNNSLRPVIARIILQEHPEYEKKLELRRSPLDALMGVRR